MEENYEKNEIFPHTVGKNGKGEKSKKSFKKKKKGTQGGMSDTKRTAGGATAASGPSSLSAQAKPLAASTGDEDEIVPVADVIVFFECSKKDSKKNISQLFLSC